MFNAETIVRAIMGAFGITPEHVSQGMAAVQNVVAEIDAFKGGAANMVRHFNGRLDAIEARQIRIENLLNDPADDAGLKRNRNNHAGVIGHERNNAS
jgi:hypothetical protein